MDGRTASVVYLPVLTFGCWFLCSAPAFGQTLSQVGQGSTARLKPSPKIMSVSTHGIQTSTHSGVLPASGAPSRRGLQQLPTSVAEHTQVSTWLDLKAQGYNASTIFLSGGQVYVAQRDGGISPLKILPYSLTDGSPATDVAMTGVNGTWNGDDTKGIWDNQCVSIMEDHSNTEVPWAICSAGLYSAGVFLTGHPKKYPHVITCPGFPRTTTDPNNLSVHTPFWPKGLAVDPNNPNLVYVADYNSSTIRKFLCDDSTPSDTLIAGTWGVPSNKDGSANDVQLTYCEVMQWYSTTDSACYTGGCKTAVKIVNVNSQEVRTVAGLGADNTSLVSDQPTSLQLGWVRGFAQDRKDGTWYLSDSDNNKIWGFSANFSEAWVVAGSGTAGFENGNGTTAKFSYPRRIVAPGDGRILVLDEKNAKVRQITLPVGGWDSVLHPRPPSPPMPPSPPPPLPPPPTTPTPPSPSPSPSQPASSAPPPPAPPLDPLSTATQKSGLSSGGKAGIAVGVILLVLLAALFIVLVLRKRNGAPTPYLNDPEKPNVDAVALIGVRPVDARIMDAALDIPGLAKGEVFTRATAHSYQWLSLSPEQQQSMIAIEAGITDTALMSSSDVYGNRSGAVELTKQELQRQIVLLTSGLLGRGATGLVFKCVWPSRFGPNAVLAAKVIKDGFECDTAVLQSFSYEASVLASLEPPHPNVVRLYGYCLEPPTVCLIMELLPYSLKEVLYKGVDFKLGKISEFASQAQSTAIGVGISGMSELQAHQRDTSYLTSSSEGTSTAMSVASKALTSGCNLLPNPARKNINRASTLKLRQVLQISIEVAAGLKYLHAKPLAPELAVATGDTDDLEAVDEMGTQVATGSANAVANNGTTPGRKTSKIVHRDLKPANILFNSAGQAKISDFGLARPQQGTTLITEHVGAGTLPYMAPELLAGSRVGVAAAVPATNRVDVYSTAMIMWEMLSGCMPWSNMIESTLIASVMGGRRPQLPFANDKKDMPLVSSSVLQQPPTLDTLPEFNAIIRACWQQREHRRPTAEALYDMLTALLAKLETGGSQEV